MCFSARYRALSLACLAALAVAPLCAEEVARPDLLSFAHGAVPVSISTQGTDLRVTETAAIAMIDGSPSGFVVTEKPGIASDAVEIVIALPAPTRFDRFAVPGIFETPSPSQTFFREVTVQGATDGAEGSWHLLASGELGRHDAAGQQTTLALAPEQHEVRFVRVRLSGGISIERDKTFFEFSELIGEGVQQAAALSNGFGGLWKGRGVKLELTQDGAVVSGCYDASGRLGGTIEGRVLRALGRDAAGVASQFILIATPEGGLRGLRSTNGAPFKPYDGQSATGPSVCPAPEPLRLGCGSVIHGIGFDYDSDVIRPASQPLIGRLFEGLREAGGGPIGIIGHSSSEGAEAYNRDLSQRRAQSVVSALVALGLDPARISALGRGEEEPIASNDSEAGRSLNRRVEVRCSG